MLFGTKTNMNFNENSNEVKFHSSMGTVVAHCSIVGIAITAICLGAWGSFAHLRSIKESRRDIKPMKMKMAAAVPLMVSCELFGLYLLIKTLPSRCMKILIDTYTVYHSVRSSVGLFGIEIQECLPSCFDNARKLSYTVYNPTTRKRRTVFNLKLNSKHLVSLALCCIPTILYLSWRNWLISNLLAILLAANSIKYYYVSNMKTAMVLLLGHFVYDIVWVFGTEVMTTIASSIDSPLIVLFPADLFQNGLSSSQFSMLGLGDIVIPGIYISFLLRFDMSLNQSDCFYFFTGLIAYALGLMAATSCFFIYNRSQPALLYLVPACTSMTFLCAALKGQWTSLWSYDDCHTEKDPKSD